MTTVVILQPGYLPWLGFFHQMHRSDIFVYYDDVQFDKNGWRNRNRMKSSAGPIWLTVPVRHKHLAKPNILDIEIDNRGPWARKHVQTLTQLYAAAPFRKQYLPELSELLGKPWKHLVDLDLAVANLMANWLGIERPIHRSSELGIGGDQSERLLRICRHFGAHRYLSGDSARDYLNVELFERHDITVEWQNYQHPQYPQLHGKFLPYLSAIDLILNAGPESARILAGQMQGSLNSETESEIN